MVRPATLVFAWDGAMGGAVGRPGIADFEVWQAVGSHF